MHSASSPRATLDDFGAGLQRIATDLRAHEGQHAGAWTRRSVVYHLRHALVHLVSAIGWMLVSEREQVDLHLTHGCTRTLMALTRFADGRPWRGCRPSGPSPTPLRPRAA